MSPSHIFKAAIYCRLSQDDGQTGDSSSIQNQKAMLQDYCKRQGFKIVDFYVDDGYSGVNFNRPDFQRMLNDIEIGKVNLVITKDLSRFGRDYIQTGYYTEVLFPEKGIRYISLNDNVDTARQDNDIAPFKNILNDMYSRDLSRRIRSSKKQQALRGDFLAGQTAYGYKLDPTNKRKLIIDPEAAEIVKEIFRLAMTGLGAPQITHRLRDQNIMSPGYYKAKQGDTRFYRWILKKPENQWGFSTIRAILRDQVYIGNMVNHKCQAIHYKTKKRTVVPKDQRIIVENTHEAIIDRDTFNRVQDLVTCRHHSKKHDIDDMFKRIMFCEECGYRLSMAHHKGRIWYNCVNRWKTGRCTRSHYIGYKNLYNIVYENLKKMFKAVNSGELVEKLNANVNYDNKKDKIVAEKGRIERRLPILDIMLQKLYEDYVCGHLTVDNYEKLLCKYQEEQKSLKEQLMTINTELLKETDQTENLRKLKEVVNRFLNFRKLNSTLLHELIDRIEVGHAEIVDGQNQHNINIIYRFIETKV